jgi:hypothetical protein
MHFADPPEDSRQPFCRLPRWLRARRSGTQSAELEASSATNSAPVAAKTIARRLHPHDQVE